MRPARPASAHLCPEGRRGERGSPEAPGTSAAAFRGMIKQIIKGAMLKKALGFAMRHKMLGMAGLLALGYANRARLEQALSARRASAS